MTLQRRSQYSLISTVLAQNRLTRSGKIYHSENHMTNLLASITATVERNAEILKQLPVMEIAKDQLTLVRQSIPAVLKLIPKLDPPSLQALEVDLQQKLDLNPGCY